MCLFTSQSLKLGKCPKHFYTKRDACRLLLQCYPVKKTQFLWVSHTSAGFQTTLSSYSLPRLHLFSLLVLLEGRMALWENAHQRPTRDHSPFNVTACQIQWTQTKQTASPPSREHLWTLTRVIRWEGAKCNRFNSFLKTHWSSSTHPLMILRFKI